jgi:hypothetical protein
MSSRRQTIWPLIKLTKLKTKQKNKNKNKKQKIGREAK